jgi:hypothetical protein
MYGFPGGIPGGHSVFNPGLGKTYRATLAQQRRGRAQCHQQ